MDIPNPLRPTTRLGFHWFQDTLHFRESDLQTWLPELKSLGSSWLILQAPTDRAIPESFLHGLIASGIEPILHFPLSLARTPSTAELGLFLDSYARWGIKYVALFDRPNNRSAWPQANWTQEDLVERFLDRFVPLAGRAVQAGLKPVFPPLEPGGNYWDTSFLREALLSLKRRKEDEILSQMALAAYGWTHEHSLNWGAGGPERWPGARPYATPEGEENQLGFHIFDWYSAVSRAALGHALPIIIFGAGLEGDPSGNSKGMQDPNQYAEKALTIARLLANEELNQPERTEAKYDPIPPEVIACNFYSLATPANSLPQPHSWYQSDGKAMPVVGILRQWNSVEKASRLSKAILTDAEHPVRHYLLLPVYEWGIADWHLEIIRPYLKKYMPAVGFSLDEARHAGHVTVINSPQRFTDADLNQLRSTGCIVEEICGDGTSIATQLAER